MGEKPRVIPVHCLRSISLPPPLLYRSSLDKIFEEREALTRPGRVHVDPRGTKIYGVLIVAVKKVRRFLEYYIYIYIYAFCIEMERAGDGIGP